MFEYDSSQVTSGHWANSAQLRPGIARQAYADRKAARVLKEDAQRRKADRSRLIAAFWSAVKQRVRGIARAVLHRSAAETSSHR